jgi:hypothetical protein
LRERHRIARHCLRAPNRTCGQRPHRPHDRANHEAGGKNQQSRAKHPLVPHRRKTREWLGQAHNYYQWLYFVEYSL